MPFHSFCSAFCGGSVGVDSVCFRVFASDPRESNAESLVLALSYQILMKPRQLEGRVRSVVVAVLVCRAILQSRMVNSST